MEVVGALLDKERPAALPRGKQTGLDGLVSDLREGGREEGRENKGQEGRERGREESRENTCISIAVKRNLFLKRTWPTMASFSSSGNSAGTMPDVSMLLTSSRKPTRIHGERQG